MTVFPEGFFSHSKTLMDIKTILKFNMTFLIVISQFPQTAFFP